jgi:hypothetical protein
MDFLLPYIDETKTNLAIRKVKPIIKSPQQTTVTLLQPKKSRPEEETILYTSAPSNTITYSVQTVATSKDSSSQEAKNDAHQQTQDIQQFYNHAGVKIIGEDYITTYQSGGGEQLIYQTTSGPTVEEIQQQQQQQEIMQHEAEQNESVQESKQQLTNATIIPIPQRGERPVLPHRTLARL